MKLKQLFTDQNRQKIKDLAYNIGAILLLNVTIQFVLYPYIQRRIGNEAYGVALSLLSLVTITANTIGTAANYSRLVNERGLSPANGDYNLFLLVAGLLSAGIGTAYLWSLDLLTPMHVAVYSLLILATAFRYYSDVGYKLSGNFLYYFLFYSAIALGYLAGLVVYHLTDHWMTAILTGEIFGILFSVFASSIYRRAFRPSRVFGTVLKSLLYLTLSTLLENLTMNADRLVLMALAGGEAVSIYYTASLFGKVAALLTVPLNALIISYLIHYDKPLTRPMWALFTGVGAVLGVLILGGCLLGSYLILPYLYPDLFALSRPYFLEAITAQVFYFVSSVLLVVLLRFRGEKKQFYFNLLFGVEFFVLVVIGTLRTGLEGFVTLSLIAMAIRFVLVSVWGFLPERAPKEK